MNNSASGELRNLTYAAVGFCLIGFQRTMVLRRDVEKVAMKALTDLASIPRRLSK